MKKTISILLTLIIVFSCSAQAFAINIDKVDALTRDVGTYLYETVKKPIVSPIGGEWAVLGLARSEMDISDEYFEKYYQTVEKHLKTSDGVLHKKKHTEYSRVVVALTSIGKNPTDVAGHNLLEPLGDYEKTVWQGISGATWALIALDSGNYDIPKNSDAKIQATRELYINYILEKQTPDGGWALSGDIADSDVTGMALQALSKYQDDNKVKSATAKALSCLSHMQNENGGFTSFETENSESSVQVLVALCELGISIFDERFVKNGKTVLDSLLTFYDNENGFKHTRNGNTNQMATEQCFYALVAFGRTISNKPSLYDMSDVIQLNNATHTVGLIGKNADVKKTNIINPNKTFADLKGHKDKTAIEALAARGIINGKTENSFEPNNTMTRAEFATIIARGLGLPQKNDSAFKDVTTNDWFYDYVNSAYAYGIIKGVSANSFNPSGTITREEAAVMVSRAAKLCGMDTGMDTLEVRDVLAQFLDYTNAASWSQSSLAFCYNEGILEDTVIDIEPKEAVKRSEIASILYNMLSLTKLL